MSCIVIAQFLHSERMTKVMFSLRLSVHTSRGSHPANGGSPPIQPMGSTPTRLMGVPPSGWWASRVPHPAYGGGRYPHPANRGYPHPADRGYLNLPDGGGCTPIQLMGFPSGWWRRGVPHLAKGDTSIQLMGGYSHPANKGGTPIQLGRYPHQGWMRYPSFRLDGVPLWLGLDGIPHPTPSEQDEVPLPISMGWGYTLLPKTEQQSKHLLLRRWYASCVHSGGLSYLCEGSKY